MKNLQAVRGMNDCLPSESLVWQRVESILKSVLSNYGYQEIRLPIVEFTALFKRAIGEVTDVVEKEMYTFNDRNDESLTLRPEGTAGCVRAGIEHGLLHNQEQRLWYLGPMFRYEKPQKGRYRQFHQIGVEVFGLTGPAIDAELILLTARWWKALGIADGVSLELNSIGSVEARQNYRTALVAFLELHQSQLDEDCKRRLYTNPLRILDSKNPVVQQLLNDAPVLSDYLDEDSRVHFSELCALLDRANIAYTINTRLVRGLDYYNKTVFEWTTNKLGAQNAVCAGGRYDGLVSQLGGRDSPAVGFAMGLERLMLLIALLNPALAEVENIDVYLISVGDEVLSAAQLLAENLRDSLPNKRIVTHYGGGNFKKQFAKADKLAARLACVLGENEIATDTVIIKNLMTGEQQIVQRKDVVSTCAALLGYIEEK